MSVLKAVNERIGFDKDVAFENLNELLEHFALAFSFDNLAIVEQKRYPVTLENITHKLLRPKSGGLCYELNPLLYLYLSELGFSVKLTRATVYNADEDSWGLGKPTHLFVTLEHEGKSHLLDVGFGANLALAPIPLSGEVVSSRVGEFYITNKPTMHGSHRLMMKLRHKHTEFVTGYAFDPDDHLSSIEAGLEIIEDLVATKSHFANGKLHIKNTTDGHITTTEHSITTTKNYVSTKLDLNPDADQTSR
ncbi:MAG: arylamine N-acetyltransferase [Sulfuricurvum sp.]